MTTDHRGEKMRDGHKTVAMGEREYRWLEQGLRGLGFFAKLGLRRLAGVLPYMTLAEWPAGHLVCREGEPGDAFYLIYRGRVSVLKRGWDKPVAVLKDGQFFGEMALLFRQPRTATVRTLARTQLFVLSARDFDGMLRKNPPVARRIRAVAQARRLELACMT